MEVFGTKAAAAGIHVVLKMRQAVPLCLRPNCCITATAARARRRRLGIAPQSVSGPSGQCGKHLESSALANAHTLLFFPQSAAASRNMRTAARRRVKLGAHDSRWLSPRVRPARRFAANNSGQHMTKPMTSRRVGARRGLVLSVVFVSITGPKLWSAKAHNDRRDGTGH